MTDDRQRRMNTTATGVSMLRDQETRHPIVIERLRSENARNEDYRIKIMLAGQQFVGGCTVSHRDITADPGAAHVAHKLSQVVESILRSDDLRRHIMDQISEIGRRNGHFDNTADVLGEENRHRRTHRVAFQPPMTREVLERMSAELSLAARATRENMVAFNAHMINPQFMQEYYNWSALTPREKIDAPARRAWSLLYKTIGKTLGKQFKKLKYFEVQGKRGAYRFHRDKQGGVTFLETRTYGQRQVTVEFDLCVQSRAADLPEGDVILSRYLSWKADEEAFLQTANFRKARTNDEASTRTAADLYQPLAGRPFFNIIGDIRA